MLQLQFFIYLQFADFITTIVGLRLGLGEASPFIRQLMQLGPEAGVGASKVVALGVGALCIWLNKRHLIRWANYWYAAIVIWNLSLIFLGSSAA